MQDNTSVLQYNSTHYCISIYSIYLPSPHCTALNISHITSHHIVAQENKVYILASLDLSEVTVFDVEDPACATVGDKKKMTLAVPGKPSFSFYTGMSNN